MLEDASVPYESLSYSCRFHMIWTLVDFGTLFRQKFSVRCATIVDSNLCSYFLFNVSALPCLVRLSMLCVFHTAVRVL